MKKRVTGILLALMMSAGAFTAVPASAEEVQTIYKAEQILAAQYEDVTNMVDGIAAVKVDGKWGFIDETGKYIIEPKYDFADEMVDGAAVVGYIDAETPSYTDQETGEEVVFYNLYVVNKDGEETSLKFDEKQEYRIHAWEEKMDEEGRVQIQRASNSTYEIKNYGGVIQVSDKYFYTSDGEPIHVQNAETAFAAYEFYKSGDSLDFYMIGRCVDGIIPMQASISYLDISPLSFWMDIEGNVIKTFAPFDVDYKTGEAGKAGFTAVWAPEDGYAVAVYADYAGYWGREGGIRGTGVINMDGEFVVEPEYSTFYYTNDNTLISDGILVAKNTDGEFGIIDVTGDILVPFGEYEWINSVQNGFARAGNGDSTGEDDAMYLIDTTNVQYSIEDIDGDIATLSRATTTIRENGVWRVVNEDDVAYLVSVNPVDGVVPVIEGSENLNIVGTSEDGEYAVNYIDEKYGFVKITSETVVVEEPVVEEPVVEEPVVEEPVVEEPVVEAPVVEEPVVEEAAVEDVTVKKAKLFLTDDPFLAPARRAE